MGTFTTGRTPQREPFLAPAAPANRSWDGKLQHEWDVYSERTPTGHAGRFWFSCTKGCGKSFQHQELCDVHSAACNICQECKFDYDRPGCQCCATCHLYECQCCPRCSALPCQCCPCCLAHACKCCPHCHHFPCICCSRCWSSPCACCPRCLCHSCECPSEAPPLPPPKPKLKVKVKDAVEERVYGQGIIASKGSLISMAPSPYTFYKSTTKFDNVPRAARADGGTWSDLERAVDIGKLSDDPERADTIKMKEYTRVGMFDKTVLRRDISMMVASVSPPASPSVSPQLSASLSMGGRR